MGCVSDDVATFDVTWVSADTNKLPINDTIQGWRPFNASSWAPIHAPSPLTFIKEISWILRYLQDTGLL